MLPLVYFFIYLPILKHLFGIALLYLKKVRMIFFLFGRAVWKYIYISSTKLFNWYCLIIYTYRKFQAFEGRKRSLTMWRRYGILIAWQQDTRPFMVWSFTHWMPEHSHQNKLNPHSWKHLYFVVVEDAERS